MKKLFSTSLLILAGMLLLLGGCKEDELPVSGEGNVANNELPCYKDMFKVKRWDK